jgi:hypothetical protein
MHSVAFNIGKTLPSPGGSSVSFLRLPRAERVHAGYSGGYSLSPSRTVSSTRTFVYFLQPFSCFSHHHGHTPVTPLLSLSCLLLFPARARHGFSSGHHLASLPPRRQPPPLRAGLPKSLPLRAGVLPAVLHVAPPAVAASCAAGRCFESSPIAHISWRRSSSWTGCRRGRLEEALLPAGSW